MKVTLRDAACIVQKNYQFIRIGLQRGLLTVGGEPIGVAIVKTPTRKRTDYFINPVLFAKWAGISMDELREKIQELKKEREATS
jgi:hypothetical protein